KDGKTNGKKITALLSMLIFLLPLSAQAAVAPVSFSDVVKNARRRCEYIQLPRLLQGKCLIFS
ncbi:MAG: hypothetical protein LRY51_06055, partial [Geovibrio sp.]|nr:hypothetical protein [Geovibrio sp.]